MNDLNKINFYKELQEALENRKKKQLFFFNNDFLTIEYDPNHWLYVDWIGYQTEKSIMEGCEKILEALQHYKVSNVLNDNTRIVGIWTPAAEWVGSNWIPRMSAAGLKKFAWVYSPSRLSQVSTDEAIKYVPFPSSIQTFCTINDAWKWLLEVD